MQRPSSVTEQAKQLVEQLRSVLQEDDCLGAIADSLRIFARSSAWESAPYRKAVPGEELVYELALGSENIPSLYLVSDGAGVISPPHCHETWAVIAGMHGSEINHIYTLQSIERRTVVSTTEVEIGRDQVLILQPEDIHSTEVRGRESTFHLHLYGRSLNELPKFESRCYFNAGL